MTTTYRDFHSIPTRWGTTARRGCSAISKCRVTSGNFEQPLAICDQLARLDCDGRTSQHDHCDSREALRDVQNELWADFCFVGHCGSVLGVAAVGILG